MEIDLLGKYFKISDKSISGLEWISKFTDGYGRSYDVGDIAGRLNRHHYWVVLLHGKQYMVHRVVYLLANGSLTKGLVVDHINRIRSDNRLCNLREITPSENAKNRGAWGESKRMNLIIRTNMDELERI